MKVHGEAPHVARAEIEGRDDLAVHLHRGQENAAQHAVRPSNAAILKKYASTFKPLPLFAVSDYFGSLSEAQKVHFNDGGQFDKLYTVK